MSIFNRRRKAAEAARTQRRQNIALKAHNNMLELRAKIDMVKAVEERVAELRVAGWPVVAQVSDNAVSFTAAGMQKRELALPAGTLLDEIPGDIIGKALDRLAVPWSRA